MTQRIRDRLNGETQEILVRAYRTGEYIDQFTTHETKATLDRLPKCMRKKEDE